MAFQTNLMFIHQKNVCVISKYVYEALYSGMYNKYLPHKGLEIGLECRGRAMFTKGVPSDTLGFGKNFPY